MYLRPPQGALAYLPPADHISEAKAKAVKPEVEKLMAEGGSLQLSRRQALSALGQDRFLVHKLFGGAAPARATPSAPGGYRRIVKLGPRKLDSTEIS